ncbi:MAG: hypothetical protein GXO56_01130 [Chloroflexi bacterium]|nr:hypothetical protein [Chloroflexota bacterium]
METEAQSRIPQTDTATASQEAPLGSSRKWLIIAGLAGLIALGLLVAATVYLLNPNTPTARIRDVFIILLALEGMLIGLALLVLVVQIAILINLLQHEVRPILDSTARTVNVLQGTAAFVSNHLVEPVIKLNETVAALSSVASVLKLTRGRKRKNAKGE